MMVLVLKRDENAAQPHPHLYPPLEGEGTKEHVLLFKGICKDLAACTR